MDLILLVLALAVVGFLVHWITTNITMDAVFAQGIRIVVFIAVVLWLINRFGHLVPNFLK